MTVLLGMSISQSFRSYFIKINQRLLDLFQIPHRYRKVKDFVYLLVYYKNVYKLNFLNKRFLNGSKYF